MAEFKLVASDKANMNYFGYSVAISADGKRMAVGARNANSDGKESAGAVYVYSKLNNNWFEEAKITADDIYSYDHFGCSVGIDGSGDKIVVGAMYSDPDGIIQAGSAYIFVRVNYVWMQKAKLTANDKVANDIFGHSVAISESGNRVVIGAAYASPDNINGAGSIYIFKETKNFWIQEAKLSASDKKSNDCFSSSVAINANDTRIVVGARNAKGRDNVTNAGAAYIFVRLNGVWTQEAKLTASDETLYSNFGDSVAISANGSRVVVGSTYADNNGSISTGAAYLYTRLGATWNEEIKLVAKDSISNDNFGYSVAISANGTKVLIGAHYANPNDIGYAGAAYVYYKTYTTWDQVNKLIAGDKACSNYFGNSVSISSDGKTFAIGAFAASHDNINFAGAAYVYN